MDEVVIADVAHGEVRVMRRWSWGSRCGGGGRVGGGSGRGRVIRWMK